MESEENVMWVLIEKSNEVRKQDLYFTALCMQHKQNSGVVKKAGNYLLFPYVHCGNLLIRSNSFFVRCRQKFHKQEKMSVTYVVQGLHS